MAVYPEINQIPKTGCRINTISIAELFAFYEKTGFLYPDKKERITPFLPQIRNHWESALKAGEDILWIVTVSSKDSPAASLSVWRSTHDGIVAQHLTSVGNPISVLTMMLFAQNKVIEIDHRSAQNWFSAGNKYANKIFATAIKTIGKENACVNTYHYLDMPKSKRITSFLPKSVSVIPCTNQNPLDIFEFSSKIRGRIYAIAEELDKPDIELHEVNVLYNQVGLSRKRTIWMAFCPHRSEAVGAAIAYRGPLGLNFSLIENRCDLIVDNFLDDKLLEDICIALIQKAQTAYNDFPLPCFPIATDDRCANILINHGAKTVRIYKQSIWLREGFSAWYQHIEKINNKIKRKSNQY